MKTYKFSLDDIKMYEKRITSVECLDNVLVVKNKENKYILFPIFKVKNEKKEYFTALINTDLINFKGTLDDLYNIENEIGNIVEKKYNKYKDNIRYRGNVK